MQAIKQYTEVVNGSIHVRLPKDFTAKRVELIILSADEISNLSDFQKFLLESPETPYVRIVVAFFEIDNWGRKGQNHAILS